jgi:hypothetical protein
MRSRRVLCLALLLAAAFAIAPLQSQVPAPNASSTSPTIKVETRVVLLDVVVTDNKGEAVVGLTNKDFQITEEGMPQSISSFEEHKSAQPVQIKVPQMPANVFSNFPTTKSADSVNVLLLDLLNTQPSDQAFARQQVIAYLNNVQPGARIAIFALGSQLRIVRGFTTDFSGLSAALDDKNLGVNPQVSGLLPIKGGEVKRPQRRSSPSSSSRPLKPPIEAHRASNSPCKPFNSWRATYPEFLPAKMSSGSPTISPSALYRTARSAHPNTKNTSRKPQICLPPPRWLFIRYPPLA